LDAVVVAYVAFAQYTPLVDPWLRTMVTESHMNLLNMCDRVLERVLHIRSPGLTLRVNNLQDPVPGSWERSRPFVIAAGAASAAVAMHWFMSNSVYVNLVQPNVSRALQSLGIERIVRIVRM
jgi:predicted P-loop ATPase/GTPase